MKIVADNKIPFLKGILEAFAEVEYYPGTEITATIVKDANALIIRTLTKCNAELLEEGKLKFIATATIGFDHIDADYCALNGIEWTNAPGCNSGSVMQYIAASLAHLSDKYNFDYTGKTIGIVGVGNVGAKVARLAKLMGMKVLLNDPPRERKEGKGELISLNEIQQRADIITFHVPLNKKGTDKTHHLFDENFLGKLKPGTIIINSSRGEVVSTTVLKNALKQNKIKAAVLDVWENEPGIDQELLEIVDIGTPHIAGYSADGKARGTAMSIQSLSRFFNLNLNNWYPENIPFPQNKNFEIDCHGLTNHQVLNKAILSTYDVKMDDLKLRNSAKSFEQQRGDYPLRREFNAFKISLINDDNNNLQILKQLGFNSAAEDHNKI